MINASAAWVKDITILLAGYLDFQKFSRGCCSIQVNRQKLYCIYKT
jgi:hypothetical protein